MKTKIVAALMLVTIMSLSLVAIAQSQLQENSKGGFNVRASEVSKVKPSKPSPGGISTGIVSELPEGANRWAVIIGISDYAGIKTDLEYCDDDAREFYNVLTVTYGWSAENIRLLIDEQATKDNILTAIAWLKNNEKAGDEVVFFYSGHGSVSNYDVDGDGERKDECIIPYECQATYFIWDGELEQLFADIDSDRIMFYFDSCYSGGMTDLAGPGRLICMACGENQLSMESSAWQNGQFTYYFVDQGMQDALADKNGDGHVTFEEAFDFAKANCLRQKPTASDGFADDMPP